MRRFNWRLTSALTFVLLASMVSAVAVATPVEAATKRAEIRAITVGGHRGFDRIVFEMRRTQPTVKVIPVDDVSPVAIRDVAGRRVDLKGSAITVVTFKPAIVRPASSGSTAYQGPNVISTKLPTLRQAIIIGNSKDKVTVVLDVSAQTGYRTFTLSNPKRVVIDVATPLTPTKDTKLRSRVEPADHQIVGIAPDATLKVRDRPGGDTVAKLDASTVKIRTTGNRAKRDGETWVQIWLKDRTGWVKVKYLEVMPA